MSLPILIVEFSLQKLGHIEYDAEEDDRKDVDEEDPGVAGLHRVHRPVVVGMADGQVALPRQHHRQVDGAAEGHIVERVDHLGDEVDPHLALVGPGPEEH